MQLMFGIWSMLLYLLIYQGQGLGLPRGQGMVLLDKQAQDVWMEMTKLREFHQSSKPAEHVKSSPETRAMYSITYQSLFARCFAKISGMTGTGKCGSASSKPTCLGYLVSRPIVR